MNFSVVTIVDGVRVLEKEDIHRPHCHAVSEKGSCVIFEKEWGPGYEVASVGHSDGYDQNGSVLQRGENGVNLWFSHIVLALIFGTLSRWREVLFTL